MDKEKFVKQYPKELEFLISKIFDNFTMAKEYEIPMSTDEFYTPNIWKKMGDKIEGIKVLKDGYFDDSDRRQIIFLPKFYVEDYDKNYCLIKITVNTKFKSVEHKDFLGSLLGLKIKRELMGDLIVYKKGELTFGYIPISKKIIDVVTNELTKIGKINCKVEKIEKFDSEKLNYNFDEKFIIVKSLRIDSVVAELTNLARNKAVEAIESGKILIDYSEEKNKSKTVSVGDVITIRGFGKYKIFEKKGNTKKGKERYIVKKYI